VVKAKPEINTGLAESKKKILKENGLLSERKSTGLRNRKVDNVDKRKAYMDHVSPIVEANYLKTIPKNASDTNLSWSLKS
jgi:hypothetical protein